MTILTLYHATPPDALGFPIHPRVEVASFQWDNKSSENLYACLRKDRAVLLGYTSFLAENGVPIRKVTSIGTTAYIHLEVSQIPRAIGTLPTTLRLVTNIANYDSDWQLWNLQHGEYARRSPIRDDEVIGESIVDLTDFQLTSDIHFIPA